MNEQPKSRDVFVSHASEDKDTFVRPLAVALRSLGVSVWYDEFSLRLGDSLSRSIDKGLTSSRFGLVVISPHFIEKPWPEYELRGLLAREIQEGRVILPMWHGVTRQQVVAFSPPLADKVALNTAGLSAQDVAIQLLQEVRPDLYAKHPRAELERLASGEATRELQEQLGEYRCPHCRAPLTSRVHAPADPEQKYWDDREEFECGYRTFGGQIEQPCPSDPAFPEFGDYDLCLHSTPEDPDWKWHCFAWGRTDMARRLELPVGSGATRGEAEQSVRESYKQYARKWRAQ